MFTMIGLILDILCLIVLGILLLPIFLIAVIIYDLWNWIRRK